MERIIKGQESKYSELYYEEPPQTRIEKKNLSNKKYRSLQDKVSDRDRKISDQALNLLNFN